jgi:hypothetical protein
LRQTKRDLNKVENQKKRTGDRHSEQPEATGNRSQNGREGKREGKEGETRKT